MQLSLTETSFQKEFFKLITDQSLSYYKLKLRDFNLSGQLDHTITNSLFTLIQTELSAIKELLPSLLRTHASHQLNIKKHKKLLLTSTNNSTTLLNRFSNDPFIVEYKYNKAIQSTKHEYQFLFNKFSSSMDRFLIFTGLYEELYIINSLLLSGDGSLIYKDNHFTYSKHSQTFEFKIFPVFFLVKYLLTDKQEDLAKILILEHVFQKTDLDTKLALTISDDEQINDFFDSCSMKYLTNFALERLQAHQSIIIPKIFNLAQLHL